MSSSSSSSLCRFHQNSNTKLCNSNGDNNNNDDNDGGGGDEDEAWDANVDYDAEWPQDKDGGPSLSSTPDPSTAWDALNNMPSLEKLGIDLNLEPLTQDQADQLQKDASQVINEAIEAGIDDIERLRSKMNREIEASKRAMQLASDLEARQQQEKLLNRIDKLTDGFLKSNEQERKKTQLAAAANRAMEGTGRGLEMGTWGVLDGKTVLADDGTSTSASSLLGSVENAVQTLQKEDAGDTSSEQEAATATATAENRILLIADTKQVRRV